ncbi:hypothetical protein [Pseudomonas sp. SDO52101_S400]
MEGELVSEMLLFFFKLSTSGWNSLSIGEGVAIVSCNVPECEAQLAGVVDGHIDYPVVSLSELDMFIGKEIRRIFEYQIPGIEAGCIGLYFDCGGCGFSVAEINDSLSVRNGVIDLGIEIRMVELDPGAYSNEHHQHAESND